MAPVGIMATEPPNPYRDELAAALCDLAEALHSAQQLSQKWQGWQRLHLIDEYGLSRVVPYTPAALEILENAYALDENDGSLIHHLAIAYHAMAWDAELEQPEQATESWEKALFYWRRLQACASFWQNIYAKGANLDGAFEKTGIEEVRSNLVDYFLEIHIDFICHHFGLKKYDQALRNIQIIQRSRIPPAFRKRLPELVYASTTATVPALKDEGHFGEALFTLDNFFKLFPSYPPALKDYLEIAQQWLKQLSPLKQWQEILDLDQRVLPKWDGLYDVASSADDLAITNTLGDIAKTLGGKYWSKLKYRLQSQETDKNFICLTSEEYIDCLKAIMWLKKATAKIPSYETESDLLAALMVKANILKANFSVQINAQSTSYEETQQLFDQVLSACEEALGIDADQTVFRKQTAEFIGLKVQHELYYLPSNLNTSDFTEHLKNAEEDLAKAIQLDPDNFFLKELMLKIVNYSLA